MLDRLTKLIKEAQERYIYAEEQAQYLIDNGVIVPPCKVGGTVYEVSRYYTGTWEIFECKVDEITTYEKHMFIRMKAKGNFEFAEEVSQIGKTVFLTREEAERALKER